MVHENAIGRGPLCDGVMQQQRRALARKATCGAWGRVRAGATGRMRDGTAVKMGLSEPSIVPCSCSHAVACTATRRVPERGAEGRKSRVQVRAAPPRCCCLELTLRRGAGGGGGGGAAADHPLRRPDRGSHSLPGLGPGGEEAYGMGGLSWMACAGSRGRCAGVSGERDTAGHCNAFR